VAADLCDLKILYTTSIGDFSVLSDTTISNSTAPPLSLSGGSWAWPDTGRS